MEGDTTLIKLLSHRFCSDGRTLVSLSGVNRLWRTLLRREPDGALFLFCKAAFMRLPFDAIILNKNYIEVFFFYVQMQSYGDYTALMFKTLVLYSIEDKAIRNSISSNIQVATPRVLGNSLITIRRKVSNWRFDTIEIEVASFVIREHFYKWLWDGHLERNIWWHKKYEK